MPEPIANSQSETLDVDPTQHLPLSLLRSDVVPPAPTGSTSSIDWLPDFAGYSWVAYGSSSLLVISHIPSPLSQQETLMGPIFRQVFELSAEASSPVTAVSWSQAMPSIGELAAASENRIFVFSSELACSDSKGSFCWSQNAVLARNMKVEAIEWTGSGDGIVAGGIEVVLWKRRNRSWEIAWQFKADQAQDLVSATWSIEGPSAIAAKWQDSHVKGSYEPRKCATVCHDYGESDYAKIELPHPQPISLIQWRPSKVRKILNETKKLTRHILLTCCIDGTVRLWIEIDDRRVKKMGKDGTPRKATRRSFCVAAVIEVNQGLNGTLGVDIFVRWATEVVGAYRTSEGTNKILSAERNTFHTAGHCEWLIGIGPGPLVTFWAIHCLDDISPMRFPRVTLWKRHELQGHELALSHRTDLAYCEGVLLLEKVVIFRNCPSEPPTTCSLIRLLPSKSLSWSLIHMKTLDNSDDTSLGKSSAENFLLSSVEVLNIDGHTGEILQVAVHSLVSDIELAASLDSNGLVLFWSISSICNSILGHPSLIPAWNIFGKFVSQVPGSNYTSMAWAPSVLGVDRVLLIGHAGGIDCFIVKVPQSEEDDVICHLVSTIPLTSDRIFADGPTNIFAISLPSTCNKTFLYNRFLLLGVWMKEFQAISWEVIMHSYDSMGSHCDCNFDDINSAGSSTWKVEDTFASRRYCIRISPSSSYFPEPHSKDQVLSFAVVSLGYLTAVQEKLNVSDDFCRNHAYVLATGLSDGTVKLWSNLKKLSATPVFWKLVGFFVANQGPVDHICLSSCGRKIATVCAESHSPAVSTLKIWDSVHLVESGNFMLEDTLSLATNIVALNWMTLGNGHLLLGVCLQNQLWVFASKNCRGQDSKWSMKIQIWFHIAVGHTFPTIHDFLWGPRATAVVRHATHLSIFSPWLFLLGKNSSKYGSNLNGEHAFDCQNGTHEEFHHRVFSYSEIPDLKDSSSGNSKGECNSGFLGENKLQIHNLLGSLLIAGSWLKRDPDIIQGFWRMLDIAEMLVGLLPTYHPEALFTNIYSGKWKRAYASVKHLVEYFKSNYASERTNSRAKSNNIVPQILLSNYFDGFPGSNSNQKELQWSGNVASSTYLPFQSKVMPFSYNSAPETSPSIFSSSSTQSEVNDFLEAIEEFYESDNLGTAEKKQLLAIVHLLNEISNTASVYETLDEAGKRFWITLRYHQLQFEQKFGRPSSFQDSVVDSEAMAWAFHSDCQESLLNAVLPAEPSWQEMRTLGVGYWLTNVTVLRTRMEKLARLQYLKKRDPKDCTLLYVALNRLQVLAGLFKISRDEKDKPLVGFLLRNFQEEKNRAAALKNAYVLMGRHQLELAVAFFLLGGDASSAVTVCTKNLGDEQLALVICRLVEGCGGPLECHLITKSIIPSAVERGDYWLASLMDWGLGNFSRSFMIMLGFQEDFIGDISTLSLSHVAFTDPHIGLYCFMLANKNSMKNAIGERAAALLARWACLMLATSLNRHGLPLEAVEWCSSSISTRGFSNQGTTSETWSSQILHGNVKQSAGDSSNWLLGNVSSWLESQVKLDLALQYISRLMKEHPSWPITSKGLTRRQSEGCRFYQYDKLLENFMQKVETGLSQFEQKFSLPSSCLVNMNFVSLCNNGLVFIGYDVLCIYTSQGHSQDDKQTVDSPFLYSLMYKLLLKETEDISFLFSHFITACSMICSIVKSDYNENDLSSEARTRSLNAWWYYFQSLLQSLWSLRASARIFSNILKEDNMLELLDLLDLYEFYTHLAVALLHGNYKGLVLMIQPLSAYFRGQPDSEIDISDMSKVFPKVADMIAHASIKGAADQFDINKFTECRQAVELVRSIPEDERCYIIRACLWQRLFRFLQRKLHSKSVKLNDSYPFTMSGRKLSCLALSANYGSDSDNITEKTNPLGIMSKLLITALEHISSYHIKALALFLHQKGESGFQTPTLMWLKRSKQSLGILHQHENQDSATGDMTNRMLEPCVSETLWDTCVDPTIINEGLVQEKIEWSSYFQSKPSKGWLDMYDSITGKQVNAEPCEHDRRISNNSPIGEVGSSSRSLLANAYTFLGSRRKDIHSEKDVSLFQIPEEIYKRNGELLEALCINSIDERQAALASNRKGIIFFNWEDDPSFTCQLDYIWSDADWPHNGWAGSMSTLVPTCVSASAGLGSKKGAHLGLGGATVVVGSLARPGRDLRGSGSSGIQGYAGIASSGLGWEAHEDFVDKPATVENISTRAFSSHPSRPLFLVGSSNTHIYLWEFGKDKATATYGVLPVANVPPPYALASISALQFDHFGHRFATAALDGTVCTWQLEVGGRSNICPTESSICFNSHASDVTYVTSSGSVIAAAGCSSNGMNVVIWDTLAPPASSRASIVCHQGGARSISLFDNHIGSGSVSPLIVSGGKGGDVGVHDFRYIATGKTKRHKHLDSESTTSTADLHSGTGNTSQFGDHNKNGMLWYIPKAHLGSVTKVRTIPNTSLFLTGSKDGDVKLWDAEAARLLYHWPKLHERHTFLQPSSRGYGGVIRAAVTDIQVASHGFLTCGGDGSVKLIKFKDQCDGA